MAEAADERVVELRLRYLEDQVTMASPVQRLMMLFDALNRDLKTAVEGFVEGDLKLINDRLVHAQEILAALRDPLDLTSDLGRSLEALYSFFQRELVRANLQKDQTPIRPIAAMLERIAQANRAALEQSSEPLASAG